MPPGNYDNFPEMAEVVFFVGADVGPVIQLRASYRLLFGMFWSFFLEKYDPSLDFLKNMSYI